MKNKRLIQIVINIQFVVRKLAFLNSTKNEYKTKLLCFERFQMTFFIFSCNNGRIKLKNFARAYLKLLWSYLATAFRWERAKLLLMYEYKTKI
jgi:hypothetical protein